MIGWFTIHNNICVSIGVYRGVYILGNTWDSKMPVNHASKFPIRRLKKKDLSNEPSIINVHANCREITWFFGYRLQYNVNEKKMRLDWFWLRAWFCLLAYYVIFFLFGLLPIFYNSLPIFILFYISTQNF